MYEPYERRSAQALEDIAESLKEIKKAVVPETTKEVFFDDEPEDEEKDLVEVVRCEDCKHCWRDSEHVLCCKRYEVEVDSTDFCSHGARRKD